MSVQAAYDDWSTSYDSDPNLTRDLDQAVTRQTLLDFRFNLIVEIGCGTGKNTAFLLHLANAIQAIDFSEQMLQQAKQKLNSTKVSFLTADITKPWPCHDNTADLVVCNLVLEHIQNLAFIFAEAARVLVPGGHFFISELHPFRQYRGTKANFQRNQETIQIEAFVHHLSDFFGDAKAHQFRLEEFQEWWHPQDQGKPPRLATFLFRTYK